MTLSKKTAPSCLPLGDLQATCRQHQGCGQQGVAPHTPLPETCCTSKHKKRLKVCAVNGDRQTCARMAHLGILPGSELELLCKGGDQRCMVKINGATLSLDAATAAAILVTPA